MDEQYPQTSSGNMPSGVLFAPDLHIDGVGPSTRVDKYSESVLGKFQHCIQVANERNLIFAAPGDFFGRSHVASDLVKSRTIELLRSAHHLPIIYPGNHDMSGDFLGAADTLWIIKASGCAHVQIKSGPTAVVRMMTPDGHENVVGIGGTPYGQDIPTRAEWNLLSPEEVDLGIWFTHHNLTFQSHYADRPTYGFSEINGVDIVVNGHLHHAAPEVREGRTVWHNPGSCTRTKSNERDRTPTYGIIHADGAIDIMPIFQDGMESVFTSSAGRVSIPVTASPESPNSSARDRFISALATDAGDEKSVGIQLDEALAEGIIDPPMRAWLEEIAMGTARQ